MNNLLHYAKVFDGIKPFSGSVPPRFLVDFLGTLTDARFRTMFGVDPDTVGGAHVQTHLPTITDGEGWFEAVDWFEAAREASHSFVMITLGACYGAQAVGSYKALQRVNPLPCKLVAVEPEPENFDWTMHHMLDNGIDPQMHWLVKSAISDSNAPVLFPVGSPGSGAQNCFSTNESLARKLCANELIAAGRAEEALRNLLINNTTGVIKELVPGQNFLAEVKLVSAVTLADVLGPFDLVDYLEADIQQSEIIVFPPYRELLKRRVRRIHIGTHGREVHMALHDMFKEDGWEMVFSFEPNSSFDTLLGRFETNDGVLTVKNRDL